MIRNILYCSCFLQMIFASLLQGKLVISEAPTTVIDGETSQLERPEGVSFSPSGDCLAIANSSGGSVTIYPRIGADGTKYERTPCCVIKKDQQLVYPHDLDFSPSGKYLAVANRNKHAITFFRRTSANSCVFEPSSVYNLKGKKTNLQLPASVSYSPKGNFLAVANRRGGGPITFYKPSKKKGKTHTFDYVPFQEITGSELNDLNVSGSHGIAVAYDGNTVAAVHKRISSDAPGNSALVIYENKANPKMTPHFVPTFIKDFGVNCLHSISFHPSGKYLVISHEREDVMIFERSGNSSSYALIISIPIQKYGFFEGAKGAAFSPQGDCLAITTMKPEVLIYDVREVEE